MGVSASTAASALDMKFVSPRYGMSVSDVEQYGQVIGYLFSRETELTSAALIHRGNGTIILFSDIMEKPFTTSMEDAIASDLANMLMSGLPWASGTLCSQQVTWGIYTVTGSFVTNISSSKLLSCYAFSLADNQHRYRILVV